MLHVSNVALVKDNRLSHGPVAATTASTIPLFVQQTLQITG